MARRRRTPAPPVDQNRVLPQQAFAQIAVRRVRGTIIASDANTHMYIVATPHGRATMPRKQAFPGDLGLIPNGTPVIVDYSLGEPFIDGILPSEVRRAAPEAGASLTGTSGYGGQDAVMTANLGANARSDNDPNDIMPGDAPLMGPDGAFVAALRGKVALLHGGRLAQMRAFGDSDLVQIISGIMHIVTWMGESKVVNEDGKTSFIWRGGSDQLTQTGGDEERYPIRLDVGHRGDLVRFEVTTPRGQTLFSLHIDGQGKCSVYAGGGFDTTNGSTETAPIRIAGNRETQIRGRESLSISGDATQAFDSNRTTTVGSDDRETVGQDRITSINRSWVTDVGGRTQHTFNDDVDISVQGADYAVNVVRGKAVVSSTSTIELKTIVADGVKLGRDPTLHAVKYETLDTALQALITDYNNFKRAMALATYPVSLGVAGPQPSLAPLAAPYHLDLTASKSEDVLL